MCMLVLLLLAVLVIFVVWTTPHRSHFGPGVSCHQICDLQYPGALAACDENKPSELEQCRAYEQCIGDCNQQQQGQRSAVPPGSEYARLNE